MIITYLHLMSRCSCGREIIAMAACDALT